MRKRIQLLLGLLIFFSFSEGWAHSPYSKKLYEYTQEGEKLSAELYFIDGIVFNDPSKFRVLKENGDVFFEMESFVNEIIVAGIDQNSGSSTLYFFNGMIPYAKIVLKFNGSNLEEITEFKNQIFSPLIHILEHWGLYSFFIFSFFAVVYSIKKLIQKPRPAVWKLLVGFPFLLFFIFFIGGSMIASPMSMMTAFVLIGIVGLIWKKLNFKVSSQ